MGTGGVHLSVLRRSEGKGEGFGLVLPSSREFPNLKWETFCQGGRPKTHNGREDAVSAEAGLLVWNIADAFYKQDPSLQQSFV